MSGATLSTAERERFWKETYYAFDPLRPVSDSALRAPRDPRYSPTKDIVRLLEGPFANRRYLVAGGIGSGKSTELLVIAERLAHSHVVVLFDLWRHVESTAKDPGAIEHLQPWEVVGLIGLAVLRAGTERFGHPWGEAAERFAAALSRLRGERGDGSTLDVAQLATGVAVAVGGAVGGPATGAAAGGSLEVLKAIGKAWSWKVGLRGADRMSDQDQRVEDISGATAALIESLAVGTHRRVLIVLDGLDRVRDESKFEDIFVESALLDQLPCDLVVSAHLALAHRFAAHLRFDKRFDLANEPVADFSDPWAHGKGVPFFRTLVDRRLDAMRADGVETPADPFPDALVARLAWCSGGRLRDFIGFARDVAERCYPDAEQADAEIIEAVVDAERRRRSDGLNIDEIETLQSVVDDPRHRLPGGEVAVSLLRRQLLLPYPNQDPWYLPHPLLMITLIRRRGSPASSASSS